MSWLWNLPLAALHCTALRCTVLSGISLQADNLQKVLEFELEFLKRVLLGVKTPADQQALVIDNLEE